MTKLVEVNTDIVFLLKSFFENKTWSQVVVLTDRNTRIHCYPLVSSIIPAHEIIEIEAGEPFKNIDTCQVIWQRMTDLRMDRHALVVVLGGGVLGDMGGFCAA